MKTITPARTVALALIALLVAGIGVLSLGLGGDDAQGPEAARTPDS